MRTLFAWLGNRDMRDIDGTSGTPEGPTLNILKERSFDHLVLLHDHWEEKVPEYVKWLKVNHFNGHVQTEFCPLKKGPMSYGEIYNVAKDILEKFEETQGPSHTLFFNLSGGTSAMAIAWVLLGKTYHPGEFLETSKEAGVNTADIPLSIATEYLPHAFAKADESLQRIGTGNAPDDSAFDDIIHQSPQMKQAIARAITAAQYTIPALIEGESGTGKEMFVRAMHNTSPRQKGPFVPVNCGAIPATLLESELFGHVKGSFTGATRDKKGLFEQAHGGTIFLDEIGEMPLLMQVKLLRVLQEGVVRKVGDDKDIRVDVRVLAATHRTLLQEVEEGRFREDLYYRLAVLKLRLPPIRKREGDLRLLAEKLLERVNEDAKENPLYTAKTLSPEALNLILKHPWSGNVRALLNALRSASIWSLSDTIKASDIQEVLPPRTNTGADPILERELNGDFLINDLIAEVTQHYIRRALEKTGHNKTKAAKLLGLNSHSALIKKMEKLNMS